MAPPQRRRSEDGRREVLIDGRWLDEERDDVVAAFAEAEGNARKAAVGAPSPKGPTDRQREVWEAVKEHGTQGAAARALGMQQSSIQGALKGYMRAMGIEGPLPGYASKAKGQVKPKPATQKATNDIAAPATKAPAPAKAALNGSTPDVAKPEGQHRAWQGEDAPEECMACGLPWPCPNAPAPAAASEPGADHAPDLHQGDAEPVPKSWRDDVQTDGFLVISIDATVPVSEMATWEPERIRALLSAIAQVEAALNEPS